MRDWKALVKQSLGRVAGRLPRPRPPAGVRCLLYHALVRNDRRDPGQYTVPVSLFEEQMAFLAQGGFTVHSGSQVVSTLLHGDPPPSKGICLTFDDGHPSMYELALPVLRRYRLPATAFLVAGEVGRNGSVSWEQARGLREAGQVEIGCHGLTHLLLRGLAQEELSRQTLEAKQRMEDKLGHAVPLFAYPFGSFGSWDSGVLAALERAKFLGAFTSVFGMNTVRSNRWLLRRCRVSWQEEMPAFRRLLEGAYDWYAWVQRLQGAAARKDPFRKAV